MFRLGFPSSSSTSHRILWCNFGARPATLLGPLLLRQATLARNYPIRFLRNLKHLTFIRTNNPRKRILTRMRGIFGHKNTETSAGTTLVRDAGFMLKALRPLLTDEKWVRNVGAGSEVTTAVHIELEGSKEKATQTPPRTRLSRHAMNENML